MKIQEYSFDLYVENKRMQKKIEIDLIKDFSSCKNIIFIPSFFLKENAIAEKSPFISEQMLCAYAGIISQKLKKILGVLSLLLFSVKICVIYTILLI